MRYLSTFISGLQDVVADILRQSGIPKTALMLDGLTVYDDTGFRFFPCFNNTFMLLRQTNGAGVDTLHRLIERLVKQTAPLVPQKLRSKRLSTFRVVTSHENGLIAIDARLRAALERRIQQDTGLVISRAKADVEFWLLSRREGYCFFLRRMTNHRAGEKQLARGELRPELAYMMNQLAFPQKGDAFLDPFCGSGAIVESRLRLGKPAYLYAFDRDDAKASATLARVLRLPQVDRQKLTIAQAEIKRLPSMLPAGSINKIVTDPPWGIYEASDTTGLYRDMLEAFIYLTKSQAKIVLLCARNGVLPDMLQRYKNALALQKMHQILVSGKKAVLYLLERM